MKQNNALVIWNCRLKGSDKTRLGNFRLAHADEA